MQQSMPNLSDRMSTTANAISLCARPIAEASACTIWFDEGNGVGLFEPVATHPDFQGKGLSKAVMAEGMRRMKAAGMKRAIVGFDPNNAAALALYTSMGFSDSSYFMIYRKTLSADGL